jgi:hypothetical protein
MWTVNPKHPVYIISKGRWDVALTARFFEACQIPFHIVVERHEALRYAEHINIGKIKILPQWYLEKYETMDELGGSKSRGPGAARNFCWDDSIKRGYDWHWVCDDNIEAFSRLNRNLNAKVTSGTIFRVMEDFCERYTNVAIAGLTYDFFCRAKCLHPPFVTNTRIYSVQLIRNDIPYRWRGRYNEDTDLSLRALKDGWCTVQFNAFQQFKVTTQTLKGGNTKEFYNHEGTLPKSELLVKMHPDVAKVVKRFGRWHHHVNYKPFAKNKLQFKPQYKPKAGINNYGMVLVDKERG